MNTTAQTPDLEVQASDEIKEAAIAKSIDDVIAEYGFAIQASFDPTYMRPTFMYTVGLTDHIGAELVAVCEAEVMALHKLFNTAAQLAIIDGPQCLNKEYEIGLLLDGETPHIGEIVDVSDRPELDELITVKRGDVKAVYQLYIGDDNNRLPGDPQYNEDWIYDLSTVVAKPE